MNYIRKLDSEPKITLDEILDFINYYGNNLSLKGNNIFEDGIEFKSTNSINLFNTLLLLHLESSITLDFKGQHKNEIGRINKQLDKILNEYKEKNKILGIFINNGGYDLNGIQMDWNIIKKEIKYGDCFSYNIKFNNYIFFQLLFIKITEYIGYKNIDREKKGEELYKNIFEQTGGKNNYLGEITIFYEFFNDYLENQRIIGAILIELENKNNIFISKVFLKDDYIYFNIKKINNISEKLFIETSKQIKDNGTGEKSNIEKIEYTNKGVKINGNLWIPKNSKKSEIFLYVLSNYFFENNKTNILKIVDLNDYYIKNINTLLDDISEEKRLKYLQLTEDNIKNSYLKTISKKIKEEYTENFLEIKRGEVISKKIKTD